MVIENGRVVSVRGDSLWVETVQRSTCGSCEAEAGCGQGLMARFFLGSRFLPVFLEGRDPARYQPGDAVTIGIPEGVIVLTSLLAYMLPLVTLVVGASLGHWIAGELLSVAGALLGLAAGFATARWVSRRYLRSRRYRPVLVDDFQPLELESR